MPYSHKAHILCSETKLIGVYGTETFAYNATISTCVNRRSQRNGIICVNLTNADYVTKYYLWLWHKKLTTFPALFLW